MLYVRLLKSFTACGLMLLSAPLGAAEHAENAALVYWQAFAQLPAVEQNLEKLVAKAPSVSLGDQTRKLVADSSGAVSSMRRAASMRECDWGLEFSAGPHMVMPHLSKARQMARYACLHARQQLADGRPERALETIRDTLVLARHAGADNVLISLLVQYAIEQDVIETVSRELTRFSPNHLEILLGYLETLPEGGSVEDSLKLEQRIYVGWAQRMVKEAASDEEAVRQLRSMVVPADQQPPLTGMTRAQIGRHLDETVKDYDQLRAMLDLPDQEFQPKWDALVQRIGDENPFSAVVLPGLKSVREVRNHNIATWALFDTAIAIQLNGKQALSSSTDPFSDGPFEYQKLANGFTLTSKLNYRGARVALTVGPARR